MNDTTTAAFGRGRTLVTETCPWLVSGRSRRATISVQLVLRGCRRVFRATGRRLYTVRWPLGLAMAVTLWLGLVWQVGAATL